MKINFKFCLISIGYILVILLGVLYLIRWYGNITTCNILIAGKTRDIYKSLHEYYLRKRTIPISLEELVKYDYLNRKLLIIDISLQSWTNSSKKLHVIYNPWVNSALNLPEPMLEVFFPDGFYNQKWFVIFWKESFLFSDKKEYPPTKPGRWYSEKQFAEILDSMKKEEAVCK